MKRILITIAIILILAACTPATPVPTAAVHAATGIWFDEFPLIPERVLRELGKM